jgi:type II secretion system protein N
VLLRPAWSLSWLRGDPAVYAEVTSAFGDAEGTLVLGDSTGWYGDLESVAAGRLPLAKLTTLATLGGIVDARIDVQMGGDGLEGDASFTAKKGSLGFARFPVEIPFETLTGKLRFGDDAFVAIQRFELEGPMVSGAITGSVLRAARFEQAPLRLEANLETKANVRSAMKGAGIRLDRNGTAKLRITGTVSKPKVR